MSQLSDVILGGQFLNINRRDEIDGAINLAIAAKAKVATSPAVAAIELDSAMAKLAKVIRSMDPAYDFGFPNAAKAEAELLDAQAQVATLSDQNAGLIFENNRLKTELEKKPAKVAEEKAPPPAIVPDEDEAPKKAVGKAKK